MSCNICKSNGFYVPVVCPAGCKVCSSCIELPVCPSCKKELVHASFYMFSGKSYKELTSSYSKCTKCLHLVKTNKEHLCK
jgi:hypothetical protein